LYSGDIIIQNHTQKYEWLLVAVTLIAATGWVFTKNALTEFPPYIFLSLRFGLAAIVLASLCGPQLIQLDRGQVKRSFGTGILLGLTLLIWVLAIKETESIGEGSFIVSLTVVFVPLISRLFFGEKLSTSLIIALLPAVAGLALLSLRFDETGHISWSFESTHYLFLISTIGFAFHVLFTTRYSQAIPALPLATIQLFAIAVVATVAAVLCEEWPDSVSEVSWMWLLCSALFATSLRFALQTKSMVHLNPNHAVMIFMLEPVWTSILGASFLNESMATEQLVGCSLIFCALLIYRMPNMMAWGRQ